NLKLRISWGQSGNPAIPPYQSLSLSNPIVTTIGNSFASALAPIQLANPNLKWETTTQFNVGIDLGMLKDRISLTADYYIKSTEDLLTSVSLPPTSGFRTIIDNVGSVKNTGIELGISANLIESNNWRWKVDFNISRNVNEVTKTKDREDIFGSSVGNSPPYHIIREGEAIGSYYGTEMTGFDSEGRATFKDQNGDDKIDINDRVILGSFFPDWIYGFNSSVGFKGFELSFYFQGVSGVEIVNETVVPSANPRFNQLASVINYYPKEGFVVGQPTFDGLSPQPDVNPGFNSDQVEDGSYLRLRNIQLGYNVPLENLPWVRLLNVYVSAQNLFVITNYSGYDPDVNAFSGGDIRLGVDYGSYPRPRTYTLGVKLGF
ncbi:MAG: TonB-dependent receptor, partial [Bacteroidia bacterium]|nr:TonB-dependent receptor [Bacteroidia bacterium]